LRAPPRLDQDQVETQRSLEIQRADGLALVVSVQCRIDTLDEFDYFINGGIMPYVLRNLASAA
jgi:aconitate hydratase